MDDSILMCIKRLLGLSEDYTPFDNEIITHINSVFMTLAQLGVGSGKPFQIRDASTTWHDWLGEDTSRYQGVESYIYYKVKLMWDPPASSAIMDSINRTIQEFEWRLNANYETPDEDLVSSN